MPRPQHKAARRPFLAANPFPHPLTTGFFYREKMRAIHRIAPDESFREILEVGGGQSGLTALLYPEAEVTNLDFDPSFADAPPNRRLRTTFVCGDATALPFDDQSFDAVTMFDLIEHVPDDRAAMAEALRVLRPGGYLLVSTPHTRWRYPHFRWLKPYAPTEEELFAEWGHVRRGYTLDDLRAIVGLPLQAWASFINPVTALGHDLSFSNLPHRRKVVAALTPLTWLGYLLHRPHGGGTETASAWQKPAR
jgi:SAM-dependent methyltransferase